jgi:hypothetical protein
MSVEHTHTHEIDSFFKHEDSVGLSINGNSNVLILGFGIVILIVICFLGRSQCKIEKRVNEWQRTKRFEELEK